ncbi:MAG: hypothetical protein Pyrs2KO_24470 [Pyruvatibacter sp.]
MHVMALIAAMARADDEMLRRRLATGVQFIDSLGDGLIPPPGTGGQKGRKKARYKASAQNTPVCRTHSHVSPSTSAPPHLLICQFREKIGNFVP